MYYEYEYIISHSPEWIRNLAKKIAGEDAKEKKWELVKISLSRQPQTQEDAFSLSSRFDEITTHLDDIIRVAEGREPVANLKDGELIMVS